MLTAEMQKVITEHPAGMVATIRNDGVISSSLISGTISPCFH